MKKCVLLVYYALEHYQLGAMTFMNTRMLSIPFDEYVLKIRKS